MAAAEVYIGRWTDWSYGSVWGDRVTLSASDAGALTAFIAIFDAFVGGMAWSIVNFFMHRWSVTPQPRDGMHNQLQILLRNSTDPLSFTWQALRVGYRWRTRVPRAMLRAFIVVILPAAISILFAVAGVLSSQIATYGDVLLVGGNCGLELQYTQNTTPAQNLEFQVAQYAQDGIDLALSNAYAQNCYFNPLYPLTAQIAGEYTPGSNCATFVQPSLNYTISYGGPCPFEDACSVPDSDIITMDTGWMNSHDHLGMNQPPENRVSFRKWTTCSPMKTEGFSTNTFESVKGFESLGNISSYNYGFNRAQPDRQGYPQGILPFANTTFVYSTSEYNSSNDAYYIMSTSTMLYGDQGYVFLPDRKIAKSDYLPISLFFLGNRAMYSSKVTDPWFQAEDAYPMEVTLQNSHQQAFKKNETFYIQKLPGTVLGCMEHAQFCNPNHDGPEACTDTDGWYTLGGFEGYYSTPNEDKVFFEPFPKGMGMNPIQMSTMMGMQTSFLYSQTFEVVSGLGPQALLAHNFLYSSYSDVSLPLPHNQWQIEAANWFSVGLSAIQHTFISGWRRPSNEHFSEFWHPFDANDTTNQNICSNQKVKGSAYQSFSVFALVVNFVVGGLIAIGGVIITHVYPRFRRGSPSASLARQQWNTQAILQVQRLLYESQGYDGWEGTGDEDVPVAKEGQLFKAHTFGFEKDVELKSRSPSNAVYGSVPSEIIDEGSVQRSETSFGLAVKRAPEQDSASLSAEKNGQSGVAISQVDNDSFTASPLIIRTDSEERQGGGRTFRWFH